MRRVENAQRCPDGGSARAPLVSCPPVNAGYVATRRLAETLRKAAAVAGVSDCVEIKIYGAFVLNRRVVFHAIDSTPARRRGGVNSSPLDRAMTAASSPRNDLVKNCRVHPTHWLISTQVLLLLHLLLLP